METWDLGQGSSCSRKYPVWCQSKQYSISTPKYCLRSASLVPLWYWSLRRTFCLCWTHVPIRSSYHDSLLRICVWLDEHHWCHNSGFVSVLITMVWKYVWLGSCKLFDEGISCWLGQNRCFVWIRYVHICIHCLANGLWCLPITARSRCNPQRAFHEPLLP